jgi:cell division protein FtsL
MPVSRKNRLKDIAASPKGARNFAWMILFLCMGVSISLFTVWIRAQIVQVEYEISAANQEHREMLRSQELLMITVASLRAPERIERLAREKLDLRPPERHQIRWLK